MKLFREIKYKIKRARSDIRELEFNFDNPIEREILNRLMPIWGKIKKQVIDEFEYNKPRAELERKFQDACDGIVIDLTFGSPNGC